MAVVVMGDESIFSEGSQFPLPRIVGNQTFAAIAATMSQGAFTQYFIRLAHFASKW